MEKVRRSIVVFVMILTMSVPAMASQTGSLPVRNSTATVHVSGLKQTKAKAIVLKKSTSKKVYVTRTGKKYHSRKSCRGLNRAKKIYTSTLKKAKKRGLKKCKICY